MDSLDASGMIEGYNDAAVEQWIKITIYEITSVAVWWNHFNDRDKDMRHYAYGQTDRLILVHIWVSL